MSRQESGGRKGQSPGVKNVASAAGALFSALPAAGRKQDIIFRRILIIVKAAGSVPGSVRPRQSYW